MSSKSFLHLLPPMPRTCCLPHHCTFFAPLPHARKFLRSHLVHIFSEFSNSATLLLEKTHQHSPLWGGIPSCMCTTVNQVYIIEENNWWSEFTMLGRLIGNIVNKNKVGDLDSKGNKHGLWIERYDDGKVKSVGHYEHGAQHGEFLTYHKNGNLWFREYLVK